MEKETTIPFGAKDSELKGWEYTIPENMEAEIKDGKIIVRLKESEDERIRKELIEHINDQISSFIPPPDCRGKEETMELAKYQSWIAYLERQKEQKSAEWSEEDKHYFQNIIMAVDSAFGEGNTKNWLQNRFKSLRPQPKQELSSEEKNKLNRIYLLIRSATEKGNRPLIGDNEANELQGFLSDLSEKFK